MPLAPVPGFQDTAVLRQQADVWEANLQDGLRRPRLGGYVAPRYPTVRTGKQSIWLQTTLGYLHLAKGETERAIGLLETPIGSLSVHGDGNLTAREDRADQNTAS